MGDLTTFNIFQ